MSFNAVICTPIIPCLIWCCSYAITKYEINWMSELVLSVCNIHMMMLLVSQIFIVLLELKLQYSCSSFFAAALFVLGGQKFRHSYLCYCMNNGLISDKNQEARLWDDTKLQLKQPNLGWLFAVYKCLNPQWADIRKQPIKKLQLSASS